MKKIHSKMSNENFERLQAFIVEQIGVDEVEVTRDASLQNDLGIYGGDVTDFFIAFSWEFNVDVSKFMAMDYFRGDGTDSSVAGNPKKIFTVGQLEKAIIAGRLDEEVINS